MLKNKKIKLKKLKKIENLIESFPGMKTPNIFGKIIIEMNNKIKDTIIFNAIENL